VNPETGVDDAIDPRILDRREEVQRHDRRRRFLRLGMFLAGATVLCVMLALARSSVLDVDRIIVSGADRTSADEVIEAGRLATGEPMLDVDAEQAAAQIRSLPWIQEVAIEREWPATLRVVVRERQPVAVIATTDERWALVDAEHVVVAHLDEPSDRWVRIAGVTPAGAPGTVVDDTSSDAIDLAPQLPSYLVPHVESLSRTATDELELKLRNGVVIRWGRTDQVAEKLRAINTVFGHVERCGMTVVDVRVPDTPVVTRVPECRISPEPDPTTATPTPGADGEARAHDTRATTTTTAPATAPATTAPATTPTTAAPAAGAGGAATTEG
jgi:cell division protein FtsQ